jgi:HipA-like protein
MHSLPAIRIERRLRRGSSSPVVADTAAGRFVVKMRGAGQGISALISEIIVAEIAELIGLPVPERVLVEVPADVPSDDRNDELADLLHASVGMNLGFRLLDGAEEASPERLRALDDDLAAGVLWLDGLTVNADRTDANPNILLWRGQPWLIDHGAALPFHHDWARVTEDSPRAPTSYARHVFRDRVALLEHWDSILARRLDRSALEDSIARVPDAFLATANGGRSVFRSRAMYQAFLWKRLKAPRPFLVHGASLSIDGGSAA